MARLSRLIAGVTGLIGCAVLALPAAAATIERTIVDGVPVIKMSGPAISGDAQRFALVVEQAPPDPRTIVDLSGPGGMVYDGMRIGGLIHQLGWTTRVGEGHACFSTCAFIWIAGKHRLMAADAHIAFHAPFDGRTNKVTDVGRKMMAIYAKYIGLNEPTVQFIMAKGPGEGFKWLDEDEAKLLQVDMEVTPVTRRSVAVGRFSTDAIDEVEGAAAHVRQGGMDALYRDITTCYAGYQHTPADTTGFKCFVLESAGIVMAAKRAKLAHQRVDRRFSTNAVVRRLIVALKSTGHSKPQAKELVQRWEADLHATAQR